MTFLLTVIIVATMTFIGAFIVVPTLFGLLRLFGIYTIVQEGTCHVYTLFGSVVGVLREPGLVILPLHLGINAFLIGLFGRRYVIDMRLDQRYLRSQPVNSEEGAPMGIGVWYEMAVTDPVAFLFKNADPQGSLAANVSNAVVRTLSNMPLAQMLENRHAMSQAVRAEVSPKAAEWGYRLGSVYIRKVHFRDINMIRQIEAKVVNRLRQVTSAILQDGANRVNIITSTAERQAAIEFARAKAVRPQILGQALARIGTDPEVRDALFTILELQNLAESNARVTLVPAQTDHRMIPALMAAQNERH
ncbi:MAG: band 7 protein [Chloroflexus aggregans]|uniref:Band 7 protein n=1 Tax=Chloroflexus aggregans TaxID=152260 RepID=A0A2J6XDC4_9CHLR|nr:MAG: band 7 protein [Chloroflexus aggregans]